MLVPGTWSWLDTVPIIAVALLLLYLPGLGVAIALRARRGLAFAAAPAITVGVIAVGGAVCGALRMPWGPLTLALTSGVAVAIAALIGWLGVGRTVVERPAAPRQVAQTLATIAGVVGAGTFVTAVFVAAARTPERFPQQPDTMFHLGLAQWMVERADISFFHSASFNPHVGGGGYPVGFHDLSATVSLVTGAPVVVATSALVVVVAGVAWPLSMAVLAREVVGHRADVGAVGAVTSVLFTGYPFLAMALGIVWPFFLGQALIPGVLAAIAITVRPVQTPGRPAERGRAALVAVIGLPGLAMAHFSAVIGLLVLAWCMVLVIAVRQARLPGRALRRWLPLALTVALPVVGFALSRQMRPVGMLLSAPPGPEVDPWGGLVDTIFFAPHNTAPLVLVSIVVAVGAVAAARCFHTSIWAIVGTGVFLVVYFLNATIDAPWTREFTWPWYNSSPRIAAMLVIPAAVLATAGIVGLARLAGQWIACRATATNPRAIRGWVSAASVLVVLGIAASDVGPKLEPLHRWYQPIPQNSWANPAELRSLAALGARIPSGAVVAANPWNGGIYLYVVSGHRPLWQTEKSNVGADRQLLGRKLDQIGTDPAVCAAARRLKVTYAITGGMPFSWAREALAHYEGVDAVGSSPAWTPVETKPPYTLYRLTSCASS